MLTKLSKISLFTEEIFGISIGVYDNAVFIYYSEKNSYFVSAFDPLLNQIWKSNITSLIDEFSPLLFAFDANEPILYKDYVGFVFDDRGAVRVISIAKPYPSCRRIRAYQMKSSEKLKICVKEDIVELETDFLKKSLWKNAVVHVYDNNVIMIKRSGGMLIDKKHGVKLYETQLHPVIMCSYFDKKRCRFYYANSVEVICEQLENVVEYLFSAFHMEDSIVYELFQSFYYDRRIWNNVISFL